MAAGFVKEHAAPARAYDHRHRPARGGTGIQFSQRSARSRTGQLRCVHLFEKLETHRLSSALPTGLHAGVADSHAGDRKKGFELLVGSQESVAVGDRDAPSAVAVYARHLTYGVTFRPGGGVGRLQEFHLASPLHAPGRDDHLV